MSNIMVMKVTAVSDIDCGHRCECERGTCVHPKKYKPCVHFADTKVHFDGVGSFWLCDECIKAYMADGFDLIP